MNFVENKMTDSIQFSYYIANCDVTNKTQFNKNIKIGLNKIGGKEKVQFLIMHPPYMDIVKFSDKKEDLSTITDLKLFIIKFMLVVKNALNYLEDDRYFSIVIGDVYKNGEVIPLSFYIMDAIKSNFDVKLKGIVVKNIEGNRAKQGKGAIWKYRALNSDYFIFKHEYIFVFKKISNEYKRKRF